MFREWAAEAGLPAKAMYTVREVSLATGVPASTLYDEVRAGRLRSLRPNGRGKLLRPEWVDEWIEEACR